jgi:hypothetical protein
MGKRSSKATPEVTVIDEQYIATMVAAAKLHNPVAPIAEHFGAVLGKAAAAGMRRPNDWQFEYNGYVSLRWYDGPGDRLGGSSRNISLGIAASDCHIRGRLDKSYSSGGGVSIEALPVDDAITVIRPLIDMIDRGNAKPAE